MSVFYRSFVWLSGAGLLASAVWHVLTLTGIELSRSLWMPLFVGIFLVWFAAVISALPLNEQIKNQPRDAWKILLGGAPTWMCLAALYLGIYAGLNWLLATGGLSRITSSDVQFPRVGSGVAMVFYSLAMAILYSSGMRANAIPCSEGHLIYPRQQSCAVCGQSRDKAISFRHGA